jgi:hypothetical protein
MWQRQCRSAPTLNLAPRHENVRWMDEELRAFLTSGLEEGEWSASSSDQFTLGKEPLVPTGQEVW